MVEIARAFFNFDTPAPPESQLLRYAQDLFARFDGAAAALLPFDDYSLYLAVEEGSVKGGGKVAVALGALYIGIGQFGDFVSGVREIDGLGRQVAERLISAAEDDPIIEDARRTYTRRDSGHVARLERLFLRVRDRDLTPDEATREAARIFESAGEAIPAGMLEAASRAFATIEKHPEQLRLELPLTGSEPEPKRRRQPREFPIPAKDHLTIVIERAGRSEATRIQKKRR